VESNRLRQRAAPVGSSRSRARKSARSHPVRACARICASHPSTRTSDSFWPQQRRGARHRGTLRRARLHPRKTHQCRRMDNLGDSPPQRSSFARLIRAALCAYIRPPMYQVFEEASVAGESGERVKALQRELKARRLKGFLVPHSDEHQNEFLSASAERLAWLTAFTRSPALP